MSDFGGMDARVGSQIGLVDGSLPASTRRFQVVLADDQVAQLDELVCTCQQLPGGGELVHYGIVVEGTGVIEGAELASDTQRISHDRTMPGITSRRVEVQVLRTVPEMWLAPAPGAPVYQAAGSDRDLALFLDQMERKLPVGVDQSGAPVFADFTFFNGQKGGHVSISGISGVATKTTYALFLLYMLLETPEGRRLLGPSAPETRAIVFNVKGEDMLHIDRPNRRLADTPNALEQWRALGVEPPGPFRQVGLYAPRSAGSPAHAVVADVSSRDAGEVKPFGWTPWEFIRQGLLQFCFVEAQDAQNQISFVEQRVRLQLLRWAHPLAGEPGAAVLVPPDAGTSFNEARVREEHRAGRGAGEGTPIRTFADLVDFLTSRLDPTNPDLEWTANVAQGTMMAFLRRLYAQSPRLGHLIACGVSQVELADALTVVDIHSLHDSAQRFVVGALLSRIFGQKQGSGREPLRIIVLDELNKYAPRDSTSPIKEILVDIAARGRSLGVILIGAQQSASDVDGNIIRNSSLKVVGRLDAGESAEYRFLSPELRERAARFLPGTMVFDQPLIPAPIPLRFPFPGFATSIDEARGGPPDEAQVQLEAEAFEAL